jgi:hypothetical protein
MNVDDDIDPLTRLAIRHGTDKWGAHFYTPIYHGLFAPLRDKPIKLLEIGVGGYGFRKLGGASLAMWADYFQRGQLIGVDAAEKQLDIGPRVTILQGSQGDPGFLAKLAAEQGPFDIVIDDGSHVPEHVVLSFNKLFPAVVDEGYYIIEDVQTTFWPQYGGSPEGGGETLRLARVILEGLNHVEIRAVAANWTPMPGTDRIKSFRAYHNLFVIQKGDNSEPSTKGLNSSNSHVRSALAMIEGEMARAPTAGGLAHLALMYSVLEQNQRAFQTIQQGLALWPHDLGLLSLGSRIAEQIGDVTTRIKLLERARAIDPSEKLVSDMLQRAKETKDPISESFSD